MDALELFNKDGKSTGFWLCGKCRKVTLNPLWSPSGPANIPHNTQEAAEQCCRPPVCVTCHLEFETEIFGGPQCGKCRDAEWAEKCRVMHEKQVSAAEDVTGTYHGWLYADGYGSDDGFFPDMESLLDYLADEMETEPENRPEWVFACREEIRRLCAVSAIEAELERICEEGYEDMECEASPELISACERWNEENTQTLTVYNPDKTKKVSVPAANSKQEGEEIDE